MGHIKIPLLSCNRANNGQRQRSYFPLFQLFPILLSAVIVWTISAILSVSDTLSSNPDDITYKARVDAKINIMQGTPWFSYPYPGQFGGIKFSVAVFVGFVAATCASVIESVGDYCAASKACEVPPPPKHAISRGIMIEGIGSILAGALGAGHAMTSYSTNIATISLSKTACRVAMLSAGLTLIVGSFIGKFGAALAIIPNPVLGGILIVNLGMLFSIGLSTLGNVDLSSSRNLAIIGVAIFIGMMLPEWTKLYPDFIKAGSLEGDAVLRVIFGTPMFLGGIIAFILDNTVKGSDRERGLVSWRNGHSDDVVKYDITRIDQESPALLRSLSIDEIYGWKIMKRLQIRFQYLRRVPFLPPYVEECGDLAT